MEVVRGEGVEVIDYEMMKRKQKRSIGDYLIEKEYQGGGGMNVVNVIMVEFRDLDKLGEIDVIGIVRIKVFEIMRSLRNENESKGQKEKKKIKEEYEEEMKGRKEGEKIEDYMEVKYVIMKWILKVIIVIEVNILMRGNDFKGGGFDEGIKIEIEFIIKYMDYGKRWVEERLRIMKLRWIGIGMIFDEEKGMGEWFLGYKLMK